jgi:hypothetical protein
MVKQSGGGCSACSAGLSVPLVGGYRGKRTRRIRKGKKAKAKAMTKKQRGGESLTWCDRRRCSDPNGHMKGYDPIKQRYTNRCIYCGCTF